MFGRATITLGIGPHSSIQNILQASFVGVFDVVGPMHLPMQCLCYNPALLFRPGDA